MNDVTMLPTTAIKRITAPISSRNSIRRERLSKTNAATAAAVKIKKKPIPTVILIGSENGGGGISNKIIFLCVRFID